MKGDCVLFIFDLDKFSSSHIIVIRNVNKKDRGSHTIHTLQFHYIYTIKYRRKVIDDEVAARLFEINKAV